MICYFVHSEVAEEVKETKKDDEKVENGAEADAKNGAEPEEKNGTKTETKNGTEVDAKQNGTEDDAKENGNEEVDGEGTQKLSGKLMPTKI